MKGGGASCVAYLVLLVAPSCTFASTKAAVTPVTKVIEMLTAMLSKAKSSEHEEALEWTAYKQWCGDTEAAKQGVVKSTNSKIELLTASIEQHNADVEALKKTIEAFEADIVGYKASIDKSTEERAAEHKIYKAKNIDYGETLHALVNAIQVLKKQAYDIPQASAFLQALASRVLPSARKAIDSFLSADSDGADLEFVAAPEANAYEFQSGSIVNMLEELKDKFTKERTDLQKSEIKARQAHESLLLDLKNSIREAERSIARDTKYKTEHTTAAAEETAELSDLTTTRDDDLKYLEELASTCRLKCDNFKSRAELRAKEIATLSKALEIIKSSSVAGSAETYMPTMMLQRRGAVLVQMRSPPAAQRRRALTYLKEQALRLQSHTLSAIAVQVQDLQDSAGPFDKVVQMIKDLIAKLQAQAGEEEKHKTWCDDELEQNKNTRTQKSDEVETLTGDIDELTSEIQQAKKTRATLSKGVADTSAALAEAAKIRDEESNQNDKTVIDADEGVVAIMDAKRILTDFYQLAAQATALVQQEKQPAIFDEAYKGQQIEAKNVLAFLDVIKSNFMRLKSDTEKEEQEAQRAFEEFERTSNADMAAKKKEIADLDSLLLEKGSTLETKRQDLTNAQKELSAALGYFEKLKPSCVGLTKLDIYSTRVQRREEEIQSLKEALAILNGEFDAGPNALYSSTVGGNRDSYVA